MDCQSCGLLRPTAGRPVAPAPVRIFRGVCKILPRRSSAPQLDSCELALDLSAGWQHPMERTNLFRAGNAVIYLTRRAEFSASHYYHNPAFSAEENRRVFGKCNNPHGHGHNYALEVTIAGEV